MHIVIGVDSQFVYHVLRVDGQKFYFPYRELRDLVEGNGDEVLEMYAPVLRLAPASGDSDDVARSHLDSQRVRLALEKQGVNVIESPNKLAGDGVKHSDDQRLMIRRARVHQDEAGLPCAGRRRR